MNLAALTGPKAFGGAYRIMLEYDAHAPGSVDRELVGSMVRLCDETASYLYRSYTNLSVGYAPGSRPELERFLAEAGSSGDGPVDRVAAIAGLTRGLSEKKPDGLPPRFGGTEEQIIERGSDWCADVARVGCALYQVAGLPCRMVYLFNLDAAYSGHVIVEVLRSGKWGAVDTSSGVVYRKEDGVSASTWELMNDAHLVKRHAGPDACYTNPEQFTAAGIANYNLGDSGLYDYKVTGLNHYTRAVLTMAGRGWPGGLRWLHGEAHGGDGVMLPLAWSEGRIAVRAVVPSQTPALHAAFLECSDAAAVDPTFSEVPESEIAQLVQRSVAENSQERGFRMRSIHVGPAGELAGYFHLMEDVPDSGDVWLSILAIRPRFRRSGVGTAVVARLKRELAARGFPFALARVYLANVPALRFWMRQGFTEVVPHRGDYVGCELGKPCLVLRASLEG